MAGHSLPGLEEHHRDEGSEALPCLVLLPSPLWRWKAHEQDTVACREPGLRPDDRGCRNGSPATNGVLGQGWACGWDVACLYNKKLKYSLGGLPCFGHPPWHHKMWPWKGHPSPPPAPQGVSSVKFQRLLWSGCGAEAAFSLTLPLLPPTPSSAHLARPCGLLQTFSVSLTSCQGEGSFHSCDHLREWSDEPLLWQGLPQNSLSHSPVEPGKQRQVRACWPKKLVVGVNRRPWARTQHSSRSSSLYHPLASSVPPVCFMCSEARPQLPDALAWRLQPHSSALPGSAASLPPLSHVLARLVCLTPEPAMGLGCLCAFAPAVPSA